MAQALRTIWLEPEEQQEQQLSPQPRQQRRRPAVAAWARLTLNTLLVACGVWALVTFVSTYAGIAEYEMKSQALKHEYTRLNRESIELSLELERLATQPRLARVAQVQGLELPSPDRVHYLRASADYPETFLAQNAPQPAATSWVKRSGQQLVAALGSAWQVLGGGTANTAYAQD